MSPVDPTKNLSPREYKKAARTKIAWRLMILLACVFGLLIIILPSELGTLYSYIGGLGIALIGMVYLYKNKNPDPLFIIAAYGGSLIAQLSTWYLMETPHYVGIVWILTCSLIAFYSASRSSGIFLLFLNVIGVGYFLYFRHNDHIIAISDLSTNQITGAYLELVLSFVTFGYLLFQFTDFQSVLERAYQQTNTALQNQNKIVEKQNLENSTLLKEIHHRVKNNLQIIVSLLRLQKTELKNPESKEQFQEAINRVMVMSSIHQILYREKNLTQFSLINYLNELVNELIQLFQKTKSIEVEIDCLYDGIDLKTTVPVGLLINELLSNSLKYAFSEKETGKITINIFETESGFTIIYKDDGIWKESESENGFGMELIDIFTEQLDGTKHFETGDSGSKYTFEIHQLDIN